MRGLAGRSVGDVFISLSSGDSITFESIEFVPSEGRLYGHELTEAVSQVQASAIWDNHQTPQSGGFAKVTVRTSSGLKTICRFVNRVKNPISENKLKNVLLGDYHLHCPAANKSRANLSPQDVLTTLTDQTAVSIKRQVEKRKDLAKLVPLFTNLSKKINFPYAVEKIDGLTFQAFRDSFCELLHPIALQRGLVSGELSHLSHFMTRESLINFSSSKIGGLADSFIDSSQGILKISSKGGTGAEASVTNLIDILDYTPNMTPDERKIVRMIKTIKDYGQVDSVLYMGKKFGVITARDAAMIKEVHASPMMKLSDTVMFSKNLRELATTKTPRGDLNTDVNMFYHLIACVASQTADVVNESTEFSSIASKLLNNANFVQIHTIAREVNDTWVLDGFQTSGLVKEVKLSAKKNYFSTGIKGNFTFKIVRTA